MKRKRVLKMIIGFSVFVAVLLLLILIVFPPSKGKLPQFYDENGEVMENSIAEKCYLEVEDGNLGMIIMAKDIGNPVKSEEKKTTAPEEELQTAIDRVKVKIDTFQEEVDQLLKMKEIWNQEFIAMEMTLEDLWRKI